MSPILQSEAEATLRHLTLTSFSRAHVALRRFESKTSSSSSSSGCGRGSGSSGGGYGSDAAASGDMGFSDAVRGLSYEEASAQNDISSPVGLTLLLGKIMTVLSDLMNPDGSRGDSEAQRFALQLVNVALEAGGASIGSIAPLVDILRGDVCRHLLRATQSEDLATFSVALRVVFNLFMSIKDHMKTQLEVFLTSVHIRLLTSTNTNTKDEAAEELHSARQELALESLLEFCREPALMHDLYTNYDCDVQCTNLFDAIIHVLCRCALPTGEVFEPTLIQPDVIAINSSAVSGLVGRRHSPFTHPSQAYPSVAMATAFANLEKSLIQPRRATAVLLYTSALTPFLLFSNRM